MNTVILVFFSFSLILGLTLASQRGRDRLATRSRSAWILDLANLTLQGTVVPLLQLAIGVIALNFFFRTLADRSSAQGGLPLQSASSV